MADACTCKTANKRDAWKVDMIEGSRYGTIYAWVSCSECGATWKTAAQYKRSINGSANFREAFGNEEANRISILQQKIYELDKKLSAIDASKKRYERQLQKIRLAQARRQLLDS